MRPIVLCFALAALAACKSSSVNTVQSASPSGALYEKVVFSGILDQKVRIENVRQDVVDDFLRVQVDLSNHRTQKQTFVYMFEWFDANGMQVAQTASHWTQATIFPGETRSFLGTAGSPDATDFRFKVKAK